MGRFVAHRRREVRSLAFRAQFTFWQGRVLGLTEPNSYGFFTCLFTDLGLASYSFVLRVLPQGNGSKIGSPCSRGPWKVQLPSRLNYCPGEMCLRTHLLDRP